MYVCHIAHQNICQFLPRKVRIPNSDYHQFSEWDASIFSPSGIQNILCPISSTIVDTITFVYSSYAELVLSCIKYWRLQHSIHSFDLWLNVPSPFKVTNVRLYFVCSDIIRNTREMVKYAYVHIRISHISHKHRIVGITMKFQCMSNWLAWRNCSV